MQAEFPVSSRVTATAIALSGITIDPGLSEFEDTAIADNKEISKRYMVMHIEYEAAGFRRSRGSGGGSSPHRLFVT